MDIRRLFPATTWFLRQLTSRPARRIYFCILAIILIPAIALRVEAMIFQFRVEKLMSGLATLRIGVTPKAEALSRVPQLGEIRSASKDYKCGADECFGEVIPNSRFSRWIFAPTYREEHRTVNSALYWWGFRYWDLIASVDFTSGKVSQFSYRLLLSPKPSSFIGDAILIAVSSRDELAERQLSWDVDESPNYFVYHGSKWTDLYTGVYFTRDAPRELAGHAFDLHLDCLWSLVGCRTANDLLPQAERDRVEIRRAALERLNGPNPCPLRILQRRARDTEDILLVEVKNASPKINESEFGAYRLASFRLLRVLKGKAERPLDSVWVNAEIQIGGMTARNSAIDLLSPGERILLFSGASTNIDEPCEAMAGTEGAVNTVVQGLRGSKP